MSNKKKWGKLKAKRSARRVKAEGAQYEKLVSQGHVANGVVMPEGAVAANLAEQAAHNSYSPTLYYLDQPFTCVDCCKQEVWTATQQKWYYEVAKGSIYGRAIRCRVCRQKQRREKSG